MTPEEVLSFYPTQAAACRAAGVKRSAFQIWKQTGVITDKPQLVLFFMSGGNLIPSKDVLKKYKITPELLKDIKAAAKKRYPLTPNLIDGRCA